MQVYYDNRPSILEKVGDGSYRYRWNITEVEMPNDIMEDNEKTRTQWSCVEVIIFAPLSPNKITEKVIAELWDSNYEQKLLNEYNASTLGMYDEETATNKINKYKAFLRQREAIKHQIDEDCKMLNIIGTTSRVLI